jgi:hypothetical protein
MVAADAGDWSCREQQQMISQVLYISRRMFSLLTLVLSPTGSFCTVIPVLRD